MLITAPSLPVAQPRTEPISSPVGAPDAQPWSTIVSAPDADTVAVDLGGANFLKLPKIPGLPGPFDVIRGVKDLMGPPKPGSLADKADMLAVKTAQRLRTERGNEWAQRLDRDGTHKIWFDFAKRMRAERGGGIGGAWQGWLDTALVAATLATNAAATYVGKQVYDRKRPYEQDWNVTSVVGRPFGSSYPSGHASSAFAAARVIAKLEPSLAREAYSVATQVALSRVYAGVHFPSDVVAGAILGTTIGEAALRATDH